MGKTYTIGAARNFTAIPTGDYTLTLKSWAEVTEDKDSEFSKKGDLKVELTWLVDVASEDGEDVTRRVRFAPPSSWNGKSTFVKVAEALRLVDHDKAKSEGATVDWDKGIGKTCIGSILRHPKESEPTALTDTIKSYSPMPAKPVFGGGEPAVPLAPAPRANPLLARARKMNLFAGKPDNLTADMNSQVLATHIRSLGAEPMNDNAVRMLVDAQDFLQIAGGTVPEIDKSETIEQGLKALDILEKALDALGWLS